MHAPLSPLIENYLREAGFLARGDGRPGMQGGAETNQCVDREASGVL
ncbi:hypothetical protein Gotur_014997 [Gossypium turneri]